MKAKSLNDILEQRARCLELDKINNYRRLYLINVCTQRARWVRGLSIFSPHRDLKKPLRFRGSPK